MLKKIALISLASLLVCGCKETTSPKAKADSSTVSTSADATIFPATSDVIVLDMHNGTARLKIRKKERQTIQLRFASGDYTKMAGKLIPADSMANIHFNQIVMPNSEMDGPFGMEMTYDLPARGNYDLMIGESLMTGDPWAGDVEVEITLSR